MLKIRLLLLITALVAVSFLSTTCAKINKDQPCGTLNINNNNEALFKDSNGNCYYIDNQTGKQVYIANSTCNC
jgi:hypothetical protein